VGTVAGRVTVTSGLTRKLVVVLVAGALGVVASAVSWVVRLEVKVPLAVTAGLEHEYVPERAPVEVNEQLKFPANPFWVGGEA
jgi:hypothetical protein